MDKKRLQWILFGLILCLNVSMVAAQGLTDVFAELQKLNIWESFGTYYYIWDIILVWVFFMTFGGAILGERLGSRGRGAAIGWVIGTIVLGGMYGMKFSFVRDFGSIAVLGFLIGITIMMVRFFASQGNGGGIGAIGAFCVFSIIGLFPIFTDIVKKSNLAWVVFIIGWVATGIYTIIAVFRVSSQPGVPGDSSWMSRAGHGIGDLGEGIRRGWDGIRGRGPGGAAPQPAPPNQAQLQALRNQIIQFQGNLGNFQALVLQLQGLLNSHPTGPGQTSSAYRAYLVTLPPQVAAPLFQQLNNNLNQLRNDIGRMTIQYRTILTDPQFGNLTGGPNGEQAAFQNLVTAYLNQYNIAVNLMV